MVFLAAYVISLNQVVDSPELVLEPGILPMPQIIPFTKFNSDVNTSAIEDFFVLPNY